MSGVLPTEEVLEVAEQISRSLKQTEIRTAAIVHGLLERDEVRDFLEYRGVDVGLLRAQNIEKIRVDERVRDNFYLGELTRTNNVDDIVTTGSSMVDEHHPEVEGLEGVLLLYVVLVRNPNADSSVLLNDYNITADIAEEYCTEFSKHIELSTPEDRALTVVDYQPFATGDFKDSALAKYAVCLNDLASERKLPPLIGRDQEIGNVVRILRRKGKNNPLLIGDPGVGKTAIAEGLAQRSVDNQLPHDLKGLRVFNLDLGRLVAGTRYRGDFEERLEAVVDDLQKLGPDALLFVDEFHQLIGAGRAGGAMDASNILKPALARGHISCMGSTTYDEYRKYIEKDRALARRFKPVNVDEPPVDKAYEIMDQIKGYYEAHHDCVIPAETTRAVVDLSVRHVTDRCLPDKAIDLMDEAGAMLREIPNRELMFDTQTNCPVLSPDIVTRALAETTGLPLDKLTTSDRSKILSLDGALRSVVFGQDDAIDQVVKAYKRARADLIERKGPIASFMFKGPTGVGKTELAMQAAEHLDMEFHRIDMSELMEKHSVAKLIGAPPGYVGYDEGGLLTEPVRRKPHMVLLLDEIEKAHPDVFNILLQVMDYGKLTDSSGNPVDFKNTLLIMTTNAEEGGKVIGRAAGFNSDMKERTSKDGEFEDLFTAEFRNRLDAIVQFEKLTPEAMQQIVADLTATFKASVQERKGINISFTAEASQWLADNGFDEKMGARPLNRLFQETVVDPVSDHVLKQGDEKVKGTSITIIERDDKLHLTFSCAANDDREDAPDAIALPAELPAFIRNRAPGDR